MWLVHKRPARLILMTHKKITPLFLLCFVLSFVSALATLPAFGGDSHAAASPIAAPPKTAVNEVKEMVQGTEIVDPYRWLEDQSSPETRAWIDAQNAYTDSLLSKIPGRDALRQQVSALIKIDTMTSPQVHNNRYFFSKRSADQDQSSLYMRKGLDGQDELLIDPLPLSPNHTVTVGLSSVTKDGKLMAYFVRQGGADETTPHLFDVDAHKELADVFPKALYSGFAVLNDKSGVYFTRDTPEGPRVYFHKIGSDSANDTELFGKGYEPEIFIRSSITDDNHYLQITVSHGSSDTQNEIYFKDLAANGPLVTLVKDVQA